MEPRDSSTRIFRHIQLAIRVLAESGQVSTTGVAEKSSHPLSLAVLRERPDAPADEIAENVIACKRGDIRSVINVSSNYGFVAL